MKPTFKVDHYGNMIEGDLFGLKIIREPKDRLSTRCEHLKTVSTKILY